MGGQNGGKPKQEAMPATVGKVGKHTVTPVKQVTKQVVSALGQPMSNEEFIAAHTQDRNRRHAESHQARWNGRGAKE